MIGWYATGPSWPSYKADYPRASFVFAVQTWLAQTPEQARKAGTPGYLAAGMACTFLLSTHLKLLADVDPNSTGSRDRKQLPSSLFRHCLTQTNI